MGYEQSAEFISKAVMYGVDKIPDSWFEKVPGGYYKAKGEKDAQKIDGGKGGEKQRRNSHQYDDRRRTRRDRYEDEYRTEDSRRQDRRGRSSYDGSYDDDLTRDDRRGPKDGGRRRRRHSVDSDRYGYDDGHSRPSNNAYYGARKHNGERQPPPPDPYFDERQRPVTSESSRGANEFGFRKAATMGPSIAGAATAEKGAPYPQSRPGSKHSANMPSPQVKPAQTFQIEAGRPSSSANRYVPYAHLYGQTNPSQTPPHFSPPPTTASAASQPTFQQNPFAQQSPMAQNAGAGGQPAPVPPPPGVTSARAFAGYENKPPYPESPRPGRAADRYSPPYASHDRRDSDLRRARSERRPDSSGNAGTDRGRNKYVDPRSPLQGQMPGPPPTSKDTRRDSAHERDGRRSHRANNDRGYTSD